MITSIEISNILSVNNKKRKINSSFDSAIKDLGVALAANKKKKKRS